MKYFKHSIYGSWLLFVFIQLAPTTSSQVEVQNNNQIRQLITVQCSPQNKCIIWGESINSNGCGIVRFGPHECSIGARGLVNPKDKKEGDRKTPTGTYPILLAFGYHKNMNTLMPYLHLQDYHVWIDDPQSPFYNTLQTCSPKNTTYEKMRRSDDLYEFGLVIGYNTTNPIPGRGSAIFIHVGNTPTMKTLGCVALQKKAMKSLMEWVDICQNPHILITKTK